MKCIAVLSLFLFPVLLAAQEVPVIDFRVTSAGTPQLTVATDAEHYYVLYAAGQARTLVQGTGETAVLEEPLPALSRSSYRVVRFPDASPADLDGDGVDDLTEANAYPTLSPFNPVPPIAYNDGTTCIHDRETYADLAFQAGEATENSRLAQLEFVKFYVLDNDDPDSMRVYFMNTKVHAAHVEFARAVGIPVQSNGFSFLDDMRGLLIYHPEVTAASGEKGVYTFEFQRFDEYPFAIIQRTHDLLVTNLPFLRNNLAYLPLYRRALAGYNRERALYDSSRIQVLLEGDLYEGIDYLPLNKAEGYGRLRLMQTGELPTGRDIVVYEAIPNDLPRVGGIITTVVQTPLSHVNLRALQNDIPNAFIRDALDDPDFTDLLDKFVYYRVRENRYELRAATPDEVDQHYASLRPDEPQVPARDLTTTHIRPLDQIDFAAHTAFGAKTGNLGVMHGFGFPDSALPNGYGIPFYFYDEFMKFNGFYDQLRTIMAQPGFADDFAVQDELLKDFRRDIEDGNMPQWMLDELSVLQNGFPEGTNIRCRSSTNNEDLPGFSGAGLYDSRTHRTHEGHLSKTVKEVFAGMWGFRAYAEREFYRIDHFAAAMGVLVHPNFAEEEANGVGVTADPIYGTDDNYYLNTQVGEDLVTNPDGNAIPEEILLDKEQAGPEGYEIVRRSNLVPPTRQVLPLPYLDELRPYMTVIHEEFAKLYDAVGNPDFSMDIEYKIDSSGLLVIKQARPWIGFLGTVSATEAPSSALSLDVFPNPASQWLTVSLTDDRAAFQNLALIDDLGRLTRSWRYTDGRNTATVSLAGLAAGSYVLLLRGTDGRLGRRKVVVR